MKLADCVMSLRTHISIITCETMKYVLLESGLRRPRGAGVVVVFPVVAVVVAAVVVVVVVLVVLVVVVVA